MKSGLPILLLVEDDPYILRSLQANLQADGFEVLAAVNGKEALRQIERRVADLALVDLLLPDIHGFELCRQIKSTRNLPIIVLTAVGTEESVVKGLELYAEDYIVKPFSHRELRARISRVLKRTGHPSPPAQAMQVDEQLSLDFGKRIARVEGKEVRLTPIESRLLAVLARNLNRVVSNEILMEEAWHDDEGDAYRLWVNICRLRRKLEPSPHSPRRLVTVRGVGYKLSPLDTSPTGH